MSDTTLNAFLSQFADATARNAFTPSPPAVAAPPDSGYFAYQQDDGSAWAWDSNASGWVQIGSGGGADLTFATGHGVFFEGGGPNPISIVGGDDGSGNTELIIDNAGDGYVAIDFPNYVDFYFDGGAGINSAISFNAPVSLFSTLVQSELLATLPGSTSRAATFDEVVTATDGVTASIVVGVRSGIAWGSGAVASVGTAIASEHVVLVQGSGNAANEYAHTFGVVRGDIGTGYTQTTGPFGRIYGVDWTTLGPIAVQSKGLHGAVINVENYYNGASSLDVNAGMWIVTKPGTGGGSDAFHQAATSYPMAVGLGIVGTCTGPGIGFTTAIQIGGTGSQWEESASLIGTGIKIRNCSSADIDMSGFQDILEMTAPAAPAANTGRLYCDDSGGKTRLMVRFNTGSPIQLAIEP